MKRNNTSNIFILALAIVTTIMSFIIISGQIDLDTFRDQFGVFTFVILTVPIIIILAVFSTVLQRR